MDPSSKQQIDDFRVTQVFSAKEYDSFSFGLGIRRGDEPLSVSFSGSYDYTAWNMPTWHERLKPAYYELQKYLGQIMDQSEK